MVLKIEKNHRQKQSDVSDSERYNTPIPKEKADLYQLWLKGFPEYQRNTNDYDIQGAFLAGVQSSNNGHLPDTFKKPNHPTFSIDSKYHNVDAKQGGWWLELPNGEWLFVPSETNWQQNGDFLEDYFKVAEPYGYLPNDLKD